MLHVFYLRHGRWSFKGKNPKGHGKGKRPVPMPRTMAVVPPRPKMMPTASPATLQTVSGQWLQAYIWILPQALNAGYVESEEDWFNMLGTSVF